LEYIYRIFRYSVVHYLCSTRISSMSASGVIMITENLRCTFFALHIMFHLYEAENNGKKARANPRDKNNAEIRQSLLIPFLSRFTMSTALPILSRCVLHYPALSRTVRNALLYAALPCSILHCSYFPALCCTILLCPALSPLLSFMLHCPAVP
jgi:hypothetical protein